MLFILSYNVIVQYSGAEIARRAREKSRTSIYRVILIGIMFRRLGARYVYWYNTKYGRRGYLFQGRYRSEVVESDSYFLTVLRYIHQNLLKAGMGSKKINGRFRGMIFKIWMAYIYLYIVDSCLLIFENHIILAGGLLHNSAVPLYFLCVFSVFFLCFSYMA